MGLKRIGNVPRRQFVAQCPLGRTHVERANDLIAQAGEIGDTALPRDEKTLRIVEHGRSKTDLELRRDGC